MAKQSQPNDVDTSAFIVVPIMILVLLAIFWMVAGPTLYYGAAKMAYWMLWPLDMIRGVHEYRMQIAVDVVQPPTVGLTLEWTGNAWRLPSLIVGLVAFNLARKAWMHPIGRETGGLRGKLSVDALMRYQA